MSSNGYIQYDPYEVLDLDNDLDYTADQIKAAYRKAAAKAHPDRGGTDEAMRLVKMAFDLMSDPVRVERYRQFGRTDESPVNPDRIKGMVREMMKQIMGFNDDPDRENILVKIIMGIRGSYKEIEANTMETSRRLLRAQKVLHRLKPNVGADYLGDALRQEITELEEEMRQHQDARELGQAAEDLLRSYGYTVGSPAGGTSQPGESAYRRNSGGLFIESGVTPDWFFKD